MTTAPPLHFKQQLQIFLIDRRRINQKGLGKNKKSAFYLYLIYYHGEKIQLFKIVYFLSNFYQFLDISFDPIDFQFTPCGVVKSCECCFRQRTLCSQHQVVSWRRPRTLNPCFLPMFFQFGGKISIKTCRKASIISTSVCSSFGQIS